MADLDEWQLIGDELTELDRLPFMVVSHVFRGRPDLIPPNASGLRQLHFSGSPNTLGSPVHQAPLAEALYDRLASHRLHYDLDPPNTGHNKQVIRQPWEVFAGGRGNCIDLALVFCGMALQAQLFPVLAVMGFEDKSRHTVVLIAPQTRDTHDVPSDNTLDGCRSTAADLRLHELLDRGWIAIDVTLATHDTSFQTTGSFAQACEAACSALQSAQQIRMLDIARRLRNDNPFPTKELPPPVEHAVPERLQEIYGPTLARAGIVPAEWSAVALRNHKIRHHAEHLSPNPVGDLLHALCAALQARAVFTSVGGDQFRLETLRHLYADHVGQPPWNAHTADELLVLAASASIAESRTPNCLDISPLARFLLAIAGHAQDPQDIDLGSAAYVLLDNWLTTTLGHQREDALQYLHELRHSTWALMELDFAASPSAINEPWPRRIVVQLIDLLGRKTTTKNFPCREASEQGLKRALRQATAFLPGRGVTVDLVVPRLWLDLGLEHWDVVEVGGIWYPMTRDLQPRMRWSGFQHDRLRERLDNRLRKADWLGAPAVLPRTAAGDRTSTTQWIDDHAGGPGSSPYLIGCPPPEGGDPLDALLHEGCGFIVWFATHHEETALQAACLPSDTARTAVERRTILPRHLATQLRDNRHTAVIWNDPQGRDGFSMPPARRGGSLRQGGRR